MYTCVCVCVCVCVYISLLVPTVLSRPQNESGKFKKKTDAGVRGLSLQLIPASGTD